MYPSIKIKHCFKKDKFQIYFQSSIVEICIHQLSELLSNINKQDNVIFDLGFLYSLDQLNSNILRTKPEYQVFFGRTFFLLTQLEMTELLSQLWKNHPLMMQFIFTKYDDFNKHEITYSKITESSISS